MCLATITSDVQAARINLDCLTDYLILMPMLLRRMQMMDDACPSDILFYYLRLKKMKTRLLVPYEINPFTGSTFEKGIVSNAEWLKDELTHLWVSPEKLHYPILFNSVSQGIGVTLGDVETMIHINEGESNYIHLGHNQNTQAFHPVIYNVFDRQRFLVRDLQGCGVMRYVSVPSFITPAIHEMCCQASRLLTASTYSLDHYKVWSNGLPIPLGSALKKYYRHCSDTEGQRVTSIIAAIADFALHLALPKPLEARLRDFPPGSGGPFRLLFAYFVQADWLPNWVIDQTPMTHLLTHDSWLTSMPTKFGSIRNLGLKFHTRGHYHHITTFPQPNTYWWDNDVPRNLPIKSIVPDTNAFSPTITDRTIYIPLAPESLRFELHSSDDIYIDGEIGGWGMLQIMMDDSSIWEIPRLPDCPDPNHNFILIDGFGETTLVTIIRGISKTDVSFTLAKTPENWATYII
jgi:hypothetical protein